MMKRHLTGIYVPPMLDILEHITQLVNTLRRHEEACLWYYRAAVLGEEDGVGGLQRLVEVARRVVPRVRVYRELGCYLY